MITRLLSRRHINLVLLFIVTVIMMLSLTIQQTNYYYKVPAQKVYDSKNIDAYKVDCSKVDIIGQGSNRSDILSSMDLQLEIAFVQDNKQQNVIRRPLFNCLAADDPYLAKRIRHELMVPPTKKTEFDQNPDVVIFNNHQVLDVYEMVFPDLIDGFYLEAGAGDCSATISWNLEEKFNWTGLLVEAVPNFYQKCKQKKRDAWLINTCLATQDKPHYSNFNLKSSGSFNVPGKEDVFVDAMQGFSGKDYTDRSVELQCLPLASLLYALGNPKVHVFILDIEGFELAVLRTIPFDKVDIEVFSIETDLAGKFQKDSSRQAIIDFMISKGYTRFHHRNDFNTLTNTTQNDMFVRNDIVKLRNVKQKH